ncbi:hypothetical protein IWQ62_003139 [Dispira parvispora]|uniref:CAP-Gly domain-containing protein n=1 Tax=Dispira parvispora TaxID=1520584 RepID=A0A9W8AP10_9FUNG|nr:hypothetical protein IWQ62_003139 [Dispira parvispora]
MDGPSPAPLASANSANVVLHIGARVEVQGKPGTIRFTGVTEFAPGKWVGIELDTPTGKNNGSVNGTAYFQCQPGYGVFVRPSQVRLTSSEQHAVPALTSPSGLMSPGGLAAANRGRRGESVSVTTATPRLRNPHTGTGTTPAVRFRSPTTGALAVAGAPSGMTTSRLISPSRVQGTSIASRFTSPGTLRPPSGQSTSNTTTGSRINTTPRRPRGTSTPGVSAQTVGTSERGTRPGATPESPRVSVASRTNKRLSYGGRQFSGSLQPLAPRSPTLRQPSELSSESTHSPTRTSSVADDRSSVTLAETEPSSTPESPKPAAPFTPAPVHHSLTEAFAPHGPRGEVQVSHKEFEELRLKLKILESKRNDDRQKVRQAEKLHAEAEQFLHIKEKLATKLTEMQQELKDAKRQAKSALVEKEEADGKYHETLEALELLTLDREMAEEKAENLTQEVRLLKDKLTGLGGEGDFDQLGEPDAEAFDTGVDDPSGTPRSADHVQLERQNERLKEALVRLRDVTSEQESDLQRKVKSLEKELAQLQPLQSQNTELKDQLDQMENHVEDLKSRLDDSLAAEDLVEQLTVRNLDLTEKVDEMKVTIEDLEALKELNDEMEENHIETEKQLTAELEFKDTLLREMQKKLESSDETMADYENTIQQFRQLVQNLQQDLDQLRSREAEQQTEARELTSQSQAMLSLNMQLQSTVMKAQAKTIDLELRKLDAQQAIEHLHFLEPYLPSSFFQNENNALRCLLLFKRLTFKANLLVKQLDPRVEKSDAHITFEYLTTAQLRCGLTQMASVAARFVGHFTQCSSESFLKLGFLYHDVVGVEKRLNTLLDQVRQEELAPKTALTDITRAINQLEALTDSQLTHPTPVTATEQYYGAAQNLDLQAEVIFAQLILARQSVMPSKGTEGEENLQFAEGDQALLHSDFFMPLDAVIQQCKAYKVLTTKLLRRLREIGDESLAAILQLPTDAGESNTPPASQPASVRLFKSDFLAHFRDLTKRCTGLARYAQEARGSLVKYVAERREEHSELQLHVIQSQLTALSDQHLGSMETVLWTSAHKLFVALNQDLTQAIDLVTDPEALVTYERKEAPWVQRAHQFKTELVLNVEVERKLQALNEEILNLIREIKLKDQALQESGVKIELQEKRIELAKKQGDTINQLEEQIKRSREQRKVYEDTLEGLQTEIDQLEKENAKLKRDQAKADKLMARGKSGELDQVATMSSLEVLELKQRVDALASAVTYLRSENVHLKRGQWGASLGSSWASVHQADLLRLQPLPTAASSQRRGQGNAASDLQALQSETRALLRDAQVVSASAKVVNLCQSKPASVDVDVSSSSSATANKVGGGSTWQAVKQPAQYSYNAQQSVLTTLLHRSQALQHRIRSQNALQPLKVPRLSTGTSVMLSA